ncbi:hypothetical protein A6X21_17695 [Planctopirus hydrillae]|uniref:Uncharacterized protein n=1 Tax=Planctopirus hydrillae TaxID=1841610 RepID=A0A1C3ELU7_9PLAN|nr:hypothetical protein A6X21_17695 [Planctopirus hydrillae]
MTSLSTHKLLSKNSSWGKKVQKDFPGDVKIFESFLGFLLSNAAIHEESLDPPPLSENYSHLAGFAQ